MICTIIIIRYPKYFAWAGVLSMVLFHLPLAFNKNIIFYKLMGSGKNGSFSKTPDWHQWAILYTTNCDFKNKQNLAFKNIVLSKFIYWYISFFKATVKAFLLEPITTKGTWDGKKCFGVNKENYQSNQPIAVLTRATIYLSKMTEFWKNVPLINNKMSTTHGLIESYGIGELPLIKQATFSIWESEDAMKMFAYKMQEHKDVVAKTHSNKWYKEEMFTRFKILAIIK